MDELEDINVQIQKLKDETEYLANRSLLMPFIQGVSFTLIVVTIAEAYI